MKPTTLDEIKAVLPSIDLVSAIEAGFAAYSGGRAVVPPVGELILDKGEVHIKYGYVRGEEYYVVKVASGFYGNSEVGLPSGNGLMLLFRQTTGELVDVLLDEGYLTDIRTAVAGAVAAKYLAPSRVERIGVVGTGVQARLQVLHLGGVVACGDVLVWGRGDEQTRRYRNDMRANGYAVEATRHIDDVLGTCNLVVTTTPSKSPLLDASALRSGTHITAVGSDSPDKQELDSAILRRADRVVADSIPQCLIRGEIHHAIESGDLRQDDIVELGSVVAGARTGRASDEEITVADLTGVAVQDIKIAAAVHDAISKS